MKSANILMRWLWKEQELIFENCKANDHASPAPKPPYGRGRNFIRPGTCFSDFRSASKASFETPGEYASLAARKETSASRPHPPPKGHACLIRMRQHAAFGPPPWWGGSTLRVELRGKTRRRAVVRIRNALLNIIIAIIPQIEF